MAQVLVQRVTWRSARPVVFGGAMVVGAVAAGTWTRLGPAASGHLADHEVVLKAGLIVKTVLTERGVR